MNWLFFIESTFSGVFAGYITWLLTPAGNNWNILIDFQTSLLSVGIFCGLFVGLFRCISPAVRERRLLKSIKSFIFGFSTGLALSMFGSVVFTILARFGGTKFSISDSTIRILWWTCLGMCIASSFGILYKSLKILFRAFLGITPGIIISGLAIDKYFLPNEAYLLAIVFTGAVSAISLAIAWEILKDAWLDEELTFMIKYRFFIDSPDYYIGSSDDCELSIEIGPPKLMCLSEKNGLHILEIFDDKSCLMINSHKFRYKTLVDGDIITIGERKLVYHSRFARSQDIIPEALAG